MTVGERRAELAGDPADALGDSGQMAAPANKTVLRSGDQVWGEENTGGVGAGNATTGSAYGLSDAMTSFTASSTAVTDISARATIDHQYPSVSGHFMDATHESVLEFKDGVAGNDGLFSLTSPPQAAKDYAVSNTSETPQPGKTYELIQPTNSGPSPVISNTSTASSSALGTQISSTTANSPTPARLWTVIDGGGGSVKLVNAADGLCLAVNGETVTTDSCTDDSIQYFRLSTGINGFGTLLTTIFSASSPTNNASIGNSGGLGVAGPLIITGVNGPQAWSFYPVTNTASTVPAWSVDRSRGFTAGHITAPYAMAAGDLDSVPTQDDTAGGLAYHDEAVVAYTDSNDHWALRVIDYNANPSHLLVTAPDPSIQWGQTGNTINGVWNPGDLMVGIGDFDGDGRNEIVTAYQDDTGSFKLGFWRYSANPDGSRSLKLLSECPGCGLTPTFPSADTYTTLQQGYASMAVGDFDGDGRADIALAYATQPSIDTPSVRHGNVAIMSFNADLSLRSSDALTLPPASGDANTLPPSVPDDPGRTSSGIRLKAGYFKADPGNGFGPQRSELAVAWNQSSDPDNGDTVIPLLNIYQFAVSDCNASDTTCTGKLSATTTGGPISLFNTMPFILSGTTVAPLSLAAGAFGGTGPSDPPVWGIIASGWFQQQPFQPSAYYTAQSIVVPWQMPTDTRGRRRHLRTKPTGKRLTLSANDVGWTQTSSYQQTSNPNWQLTQYTAFDQNGSSVVLGAPTTLTIEGQIKENMVAAEPPKQTDWLNGGWSNPSGSSNLYLQTSSTSAASFTSQTTRQNTWQNSVNESSDNKLSWNDNIPLVGGAAASLEVNQSFSKAWSGLDQSSTSTGSSWSTTTSAKTSGDDLFSYSADDTTLYRYPVLGTAGATTGPQECSSGCRAYYDVYLPTSSVHFDNVAGKTTSLFSPAWENLNALSYPNISSNGEQVPTPDLAPYTYTDSSGQTQTVNKAVYNQAHPIGANTGSVTLDMSSSAGVGSTQTHARTWTAGVDVTASGKVTVGDPKVNAVSFQTTDSAGFDQTKATSDSVTGQEDTSSDQQFTINLPQIQANEGYTIGTAYYYGQDGATKVVHGVDLTSNQQSKSWWIGNYGQTPDPALNLPGRIDMAYDPTDYAYDQPQWLTAPQRLLIRGFQAVQVNNDGSGLQTTGDPYTVNPAAGQQVQFQIPVHNYSLKAMDAGTSLAWWAVPVDDNDLNVTGNPISLGSSTVAAIGAQGAMTVKSPSWSAAAAVNNQHQQYRIVAQIDPTGTTADMHPLNGTACPTDSLEPSGNNTTPMLTDIMKPGAVPDTSACGQNNEGYGLVTVDPSTASGVGAIRHATSANPAQAKLSGGGLISDNTELLKLTEQSAIPTVPVNQRVTGLVHATAKLTTGDHPIVAVYDGPVSKGKIIAVTTMAGIDATMGGTVPFSWTPTTPGIHELHEVLLGTRATGDDDEQIMRINVAPPLKQYQVTAAASAALVAPGHPFTITGTITPVPARSDERTVQLQQKTASGWKTTDTDQASGKGRVQYDLTVTKDGTYSYRLYKTATAGRFGTASPPVTVVVGTPFALTIKASPPRIRRGHRFTISGALTPNPTAYTDRTVNLQTSTKGHWKTTATAHTSTTGTYSFKIRSTKKGTHAYRILKTAVPPRSTTYSHTVKVKVT